MDSDLDVGLPKERKQWDETLRIKQRRNETGVSETKEDKTLSLRLTDSDICIWEIFQNPIHFCQFFFTHPDDISKISTYTWTRGKKCLIVWWWQYPFLLWMTGCFCCGKNIGKSFFLVMRTVWKAIWFPGKTTVLASGKEQHTRRLWERVYFWFTTHPIFSFWRATDMTRKNTQSTRHMWFQTITNWRCQGLLSGYKGSGFMGERGHARIIDEMQELSEEEHGQIRNLLQEPFRAGEWMEDLVFGVPNGDRESPFYHMDTDDSLFGSYSGFRRKIPSFLHCGVDRARFLKMLSENKCKFELRGERIVVTEYSALAKQIMLGQWGEVERSCFPPELYERNEFPVGLMNYSNWMMTNREASEVGFPSLLGFLHNWGDRAKVPGLHRKEDEQAKVIVAVDPGKQNSAITVWGRRKIAGEMQYRWWLLGRIMLRGVPDGPTQARVVDIVSTWWDADIIISDTSSQSSYIADNLCDAAMFPKSSRFYVRDDSLDLETLQKARSCGKQLVIGISAMRPMPMEIDAVGELRTVAADAFMVYGLMDMMGGLPKLALPQESVDPEFYAAMTSYSEKPKGSMGQRFTPAHSHWVSCAKAFWAAYWLMEIMGVPALIENRRRPSSVGTFMNFPTPQHRIN
jgi:hypothetical protein